MALKIIQIGDPVLETKAKRVGDVKDEKIQKLIDEMLITCKLEKDRAAGISAPQVGKGVSISICRRMDIDENSDIWEVMVNPEIVAQSGEKSVIWEGCLSVGEGKKAIYGPVQRPKRVKVKYLDREGQSKELSGEGYFSHIIQHEIDHLNGVLFIKYVTNPDKNLWTSKELDDYLEKFKEFPPVA